MNVVRVSYTTPSGAIRKVYMRDPERTGSFLRGIECDRLGIAIRSNGCGPEHDLLVSMERIVTTEAA